MPPTKSEPNAGLPRYSSDLLPVDRKVGHVCNDCVTTAPPPVCGNEPPPARLGRAEAGAKMTATGQLRALPPTYIVWRLIETS
jgi:hypothetical protein